MIYYIYKIYSTLGNDCYIGSTKKELNQRFNEHIYQYKLYCNKKFAYVSSFKLFNKYGAENCQITLLEKIDIKECVKERENYFIYNTENVINKNSALFDVFIHKENQKMAIKRYISKNKDKYLEYQKNYQKKRYWADSNYQEYLNQKSKERYYKNKEFDTEFKRLSNILMN